MKIPLKRYIVFHLAQSTSKRSGPEFIRARAKGFDNLAEANAHRTKLLEKIVTRQLHMQRFVLAVSSVSETLDSLDRGRP